MSLFGSTKVKESLIGSIHLLKKVNGYSAYELAVKNGFKGTEKEWLESLKGKDGKNGAKGDAGTLESHTEVDAQGHRVINVAEPVEDTDAATYKQVKVEDISDDFFSAKGEDFNWQGSVYKQGNIIHGSISCIGTASGGAMLFEVNPAYKNKSIFDVATGCVSNVQDGTESITALICRASSPYCQVAVGSDINGYISLSFAYICN